MAGSPVVLAAILLAVAGLVLMASRLGYAPRQELPGEEDLGLLLEGLPCGFTASATLDSKESGCVLAADQRGRIALVAPHGAHHLARLLGPASHVALDGTALHVRDGRVAGFFDLGADQDVWLERLRSAGLQV